MKKMIVAAFAVVLLAGVSSLAHADDYSVHQDATSKGSVTAKGINGAGELSGDFASQSVSAGGAISGLDIKFDNVAVVMPSNFSVRQSAHNDGNINARGLNIAFGPLSGPSASQSVGAIGAASTASFNATAAASCGCQ